jgi:hypothetical protein
MKAEELRIGNFIKGCNVYDGRELTVSKVGFDVVFFFNGFAGEYPNDCEGIELTEQWLEKFGFLCTVPRFRYETDKYLIEQWVTADSYFFRVKTSASESIMIAEVEFVHQLQNLYFALTGREIELTKQLFQK